MFAWKKKGGQVTFLNFSGRQWKVTNPKAIESRTYFDALGRTVKTIENCVDGTVGDDNDKTTEYTYNAAGMTTLKALLTGGGYQTTEWIYGVSRAIVSNDIVGATRWPDPSSGSASSGQQDTVTVNALGADADEHGSEWHGAGLRCAGPPDDRYC